MNEGASLRFLSLEQCLGLRRGYLVTVNMQHIYEARRSTFVSDAIFHDPGAHHCLDGRGAVGLFRRIIPGDLPLVQGNVVIERWLMEAGAARLLVIGSNQSIVRQVAEQYPDVVLIVDDSIIRIGTEEDAQRWAAVLAVRHPGPWDLIAIALGVPKQEVLARALQHRLDAPIFCLGGSFEIIADVLPRSPETFQRLGLEGLWRLVMEPSRKRWERLVRSYASFFALRARAPSLERLTGRGKNDG